MILLSRKQKGVCSLVMLQVRLQKLLHSGKVTFLRPHFEKDERAGEDTLLLPQQPVLTDESFLRLRLESSRVTFMCPSAELT